MSTGDLIATISEGLTPMQAGRVARTVQRERMRTALELAHIERKTLVQEARTIADAKLRSTEEQVERLLHAERMDALAQAALDHEEASRVVGLVKDEATHTLFREALQGASTRYATGVVRRSGR
jgi:hypothetical protein